MAEGLTRKQFRLYVSDIQERATDNQLASIITRLKHEQRDRKARNRAFKMPNGTTIRGRAEAE